MLMLTALRHFACSVLGKQKKKCSSRGRYYYVYFYMYTIACWVAALFNVSFLAEGET